MFFFQAQDGIRDFHVTGVQTCALPIYSKSRRMLKKMDYLKKWITHFIDLGTPIGSWLNTIEAWSTINNRRSCARSEERRVGKESGRRGTGDNSKDRMPQQIERTPDNQK